MYVDIMPDTILNPMSSHYGGVDDNYYYIDINQDGTNDIKIDANFGISPGHINQSVTVLSLDTSAKLSYWKTDSSYYTATNCGGPGYWITGNILKQYIFGDTIKNDKYITSGNLAMNGGIGMCGMSYDDTAWIKSYDQYIGVRFSTSSGYQYGWIRVTVSNYKTVIIKDFSLGVHFVGIKQFFVSNQLKFYPNPTTDQFYIDANTTEKTTVDLFDLNGRNVLSKIIYDRSIINVAMLGNGIYTLTVKTSDSVTNKKLVIFR